MLVQALDLSEEVVRVGRFEVKETLGRGAMGTVYRAFDPELQRDVALKVLDATLDDHQAASIRKEARALARLAHPHVVAVHELGLEQHQLFVAMEYVPGQTLAELAAGPDAPGPAELLSLFVQAGLGLQAAHEAGLVHRDIKPENLLIAEGRVRVADFGLAIAAGAQGREFAGTPVFMAPEVAEQGLATESSDQFAFCASLWKLLDPHAELADPTAQIAPSVRAALIRGLSHEPSERWPDMGALVDELAGTQRVSASVRQRDLLIRRVQKIWIRGVLDASLGEGPVFEVPMGFNGEDVPVGAATLRHAFDIGGASLLILGEPGAGKTLALLRLAQSQLREAMVDDSAPVPVVLMLSSLAQHRGPLESWIEQEMVAKYGLPRGAIRGWMASGALMFCLDGLDEVAGKRRARAEAAIRDFRRTHGAEVVVTCRAAEYGGKLSLGQTVYLHPVKGDRSLAPNLRTPMMLRLRGDGASNLGFDHVYARAVEHQLDGLGEEERGDLVEGLEVLARAMSRNDRTELWLEQLEPQWVFDDWRRPVTVLLGIALMSLVCLGLNVAVGAAVEGDALSGLLMGLVSIPMVLVFNRGVRIHPVERLRYSGRRMIKILPLGLALGFAAGAIYGSFYVLWVNLIFGPVAGLVTTIVVAFEPSRQETRLRPNQGIRQSLVNGLGIGLLAMVLGAVSLGYVTVPLVLPYLEPPSTLIGLPHPERSAAAVAGTMLFLLAGMVRGGWAVLMHLAVRIMLALTTKLPWRLVPLLDAAADRALLRRIGGGYIFGHRSFQEFFAAGKARP